MNLAHPVRSSILLVDTRAANLRRLSDTLQRAGHRVIEAASFEDAKQALAVHEPDVLISALRLAAFNGLHLIHLGRLSNPNLNAIILSTERDSSLHDEVHLIGATLLIEPVHTAMLLDLLAARREGTGWDDAVVTVVVERRHGERRQSPSSDHSPERRIGDRRRGEGSFDQIDDVIRVSRLL